MISIASLLSTTAPGAQRAPAAVQGATGDFAMALAEVGAAAPMLATPDPILVDAPAPAEASVLPTFAAAPDSIGVVVEGAPASPVLQGLAAPGTSLPVRSDAPVVVTAAKPADAAPRTPARPVEFARNAAPGLKATASQVLAAVPVLAELVPHVEAEPAPEGASEPKVLAQVSVDVPRFRQPKCPPKRASAEPQPHSKRMPATFDDSQERAIAPLIVIPSEGGAPSIVAGSPAEAGAEPERMIETQDQPIASPATVLTAPNEAPERSVEIERSEGAVASSVADVPSRPARRQPGVELGSTLAVVSAPSLKTGPTTQIASAESNAPKLVAVEAPSSLVPQQNAPETEPNQTAEPTRARPVIEVTSPSPRRVADAVRTDPAMASLTFPVKQLAPEVRRNASPSLTWEKPVAPPKAQPTPQAPQTIATLAQPLAAATAAAMPTPPMEPSVRELTAPRADAAAPKQFEPQPREQIARNMFQADAIPTATPVVLQPGTVQPAAQAFARAMFTAERDVRPRAQVSDIGVHPLQAVLGDTAVAPTQGVQPTASRDLPLDTRRDEWMGAMIERIEVLRDEGSREARVRLAPEGLGTIDVSIRHDGDAVQVTLAADRDSSRALLAEAAPKLAELAEARGLKLGGAAVDGSTAGQRDGRDNRQPQPASPARPASAERADESTDTSDDNRIA